MRHWWARWWLAVSVLLLVVASEYRLRVRPPEEALAGGLDVTVVLELAVFGAVGSVLLLLAFPDARTLLRSPVLLLGTGWVAYLALSAAWAPIPFYSAVRAGQMLVVLLVVLTAARGPEGPIHRLVHAFAALTAASVVLGAAVPTPPVTPLQEGRFTWLAVHPVPAAVLLGTSVVLMATYLAVGRGSPGRLAPGWFYVVVLAVNLAGLIGTGTRGGILGAAAATLLLSVLVPEGRRRVVLVALLVPALLVLGLLLGPVLVELLSRGEPPEQIATLNSRTVLWSLAAEAVAKEPVFGYGLGASRSLFFEETGLGGGHNALVNVAVDTGLIGVVLWVGLVVVIARGALGLERGVGGPGAVRLRTGRAGVLVLLCFLMVDGLVHQGPGDVVNAGSTWLLVCAAWVAVMERERSRHVAPITYRDPLRAGTRVAS